MYTLSVFKTHAGKCPVHTYTQNMPLFDVMQTKEDQKEATINNNNNNNNNTAVNNQQQFVCICHRWEVQRRYSDFDDFHKHLKTQIGIEKFQTLKLPSKNILKVVQTQQFVEKRMKGLQDYFRSVLRLIPGSVEIEIFLETEHHTTFESSIQQQQQQQQLSSILESDEKLQEYPAHLKGESQSFSETPPTTSFTRSLSSMLFIYSLCI